MRPGFELVIHVASATRRGLMAGFEVVLTLVDSAPQTRNSPHPSDRASYEASLAGIYELAGDILLSNRTPVMIIAGTQSPPRSQQFSHDGHTLVLHDLRERSLMDYVAGIARYLSAMEKVNFSAAHHHLGILEASVAAHCAAIYSHPLAQEAKSAPARLGGNFLATLAQWSISTMMTSSSLNEHFGGDFPGGALTIANDTFIAFHEIAHRSLPAGLTGEEVEGAREFILALLDWVQLSSILEDLPKKIRCHLFEGAEAREASIDASALRSLERLLYSSDEAWSEAVASVSATCCLGFSSAMADLLAKTGGHVEQDDVLQIAAGSALRLGVGLRSIWSQSQGVADLPPLGPTTPGSLAFGDAARVWASVVDQLASIIIRAVRGQLFPRVPVPGSSGEPWWWDDDDREYYYEQYSEEDLTELQSEANWVLQRIWEAQGSSRLGPNLVSMETPDSQPMIPLKPWPEGA